MKEVQQKNPAELTALLGQLREKLRDARFRVAAKQLKDVRSIRKLRQQIARILTVQRSRPRR